ncbi:MAG: methyltransferase [Myxococcota bacterium]|nr:methyltransferase [Myxococcota bacterium]
MDHAEEAKMGWEDRWREGKTGWDAGAPCPALLDYLSGQNITAGSTPRALVPGCGSGYDAFALAEAGFATTGLDLAPTAAARFRELRAQRGLSQAQAHIEIGDFFGYDSGHDFDLIWDYTFLCAIDPRQRQDWAKKMRSSIAPDGELLTLIFPVIIEDESATTHEDQGPPYRLHPVVVADLLEGLFEQISLEEVTRSHPGREGMEWLARWRPI